MCLQYRKLNLDVKARMLRPEQEITVCTEFTLDGVVQSVRQFLDAEDYELLENFEKNQENIKECIRKRMSGNQANVDDMPYVIGLAMDIPLDLHKEYKGILKMYKEGDVSIPVKAFWRIAGATTKNRSISYGIVKQKSQHWISFSQFTMP